MFERGRFCNRDIFKYISDISFKTKIFTYQFFFRQGKQTGKYSQVILILGLTFSALFVVIQAEILRLKCGAYANFTVVQQDSYLPDSFITLHGVEPHYCQYECSLDGRCKSINTNEDELICELHNKSTEDPRDKVQTVPQDGWTYYSTQYNESRVIDYIYDYIQNMIMTIIMMMMMMITMMMMMIINIIIIMMIMMMMMTMMMIMIYIF